MLKAMKKGVAMSEPISILTNHASLVVWGQYAQATGLVPAIQAVPLHQKIREYSPQTKVIEFLVAILAGYEHLKDISLSAFPLDQDAVVAQAWGQPGWADQSGVSRTLRQLTEAEVERLGEGLDQFSQPFIDKEVLLAYSLGRIELDGDLSPRPVANTSQTYPEATYGHMDKDRVGLGYQAEVVSLCSPTYGRLGLSAMTRSGNTLSCTQALALVEAAESRLKGRPWRRTDLLQQRMAALPLLLDHWNEKREQVQKKLAAAQSALERVQRQLAEAQQALQGCQEEYAQKSRPERPHSHLTQARQRVELLEKRQQLRLTALERDRAYHQRLVEHCRQVDQEHDQLQQRLKHFESDNQSNPNPLTAMFRLDAGFGTGENLALLIEMGYEMYSKPYANWLSGWMRAQAQQPQPWQSVSGGADMIAWKAMQVPNFPYPLDVAIERFWTSKGRLLSGMLHFGPQEVTQDLPGWFRYYNARQTIEAGNREGKQVFQVHHLKVRTLPALRLQEKFALFASNFVRFASVWQAEQCPQVPEGWRESTHPQVKEQVKVGAHTPAYVTWLGQDCLLRFTEHSVFVGRSLQLRRTWAFQPVLPFLKCSFFSTI